ncbi:MAG: NAD(P)H-quinone oxidoreductase subunit K, partial [Cyanobacteria bacterium M_surface_9_m1_291]|nr:NAD(P)H-quinone oxidoreductase subunit K [Cyanobacteria bacterium M_surface_9_m1_291]
FDAVIKLRKKVGNESLSERANLLPSHRYCTVPHQMKAVEPIVTGAYLQAETQRKALEAAAGLPMAAATPATVAAEPAPASSND